MREAGLHPTARRAHNGRDHNQKTELRRGRKLLRRASFTSTQELKTRIEAFIAYFNRTLAKPFRWTKTGKPLAA